MTAAKPINRRHKRSPERKRRAPFFRVFFLLCLCSLPLQQGCGITQGKWLWAMGLDRHFTQPAEFTLTTEGPVLVLVDDPEYRLDAPRTRTDLARKVGAYLKKHEAVSEVVPQNRIARLRRENTDFEDRGCREVGRLADAHQVVWLEIRDLYDVPEVEDSVAAARMTVTVRVVNAQAENKGEVRLWPTQREGQIVTVELPADKVFNAKSRRQIAGKLTDKMAEQVAQIFYEIPLEDA